MNCVISLAYTYDKGNLTKITKTGYNPSVSTTTKYSQDYHFAYDIFGNMTGVAVGSSYKLAEYIYNSSNGTLSKMNYGASGSVASAEYTYDKLDRLRETVWTDTATGETKRYGYEYSSEMRTVSERPRRQEVRSMLM